MFKLIAILAALGAHDINRQEVNCMATAIYHEARGEPVIGQFAVAHVIKNRVQSPRYPGDTCKVVYQRKWVEKSQKWIDQFSDIRKASPNRESQAWTKAVVIATRTLQGRSQDPTGGATNYYAHNKTTPWWARYKQRTAVLGGHTFMVAKR